VEGCRSDRLNLEDDGAVSIFQSRLFAQIAHILDIHFLMTPLVRENAGHDFGGLIKHVMGCSDLDGHAAMDGEGAVNQTHLEPLFTPF
jgi:hypothetical protein